MLDVPVDRVGHQPGEAFHGPRYPVDVDSPWRWDGPQRRVVPVGEAGGAPERAWAEGCERVIRSARRSSDEGDVPWMAVVAHVAPRVGVTAGSVA